MKNEDNLLDSAAKVFRDRISSGSSRFQALLDPAGPAAPSVEEPMFASGKMVMQLPHTLRLSRSMESAVTQVGDMPPEPPTMRGRMGAMLVQAMRRALFWYTGQIRGFQAMVAESARELGNALQELGSRQEREQSMLSSLNDRLSAMEPLNRKVEAFEQSRVSAAEEERRRRSALDGRLGEIDRTLNEVRQLIDGAGKDLRLKLQQERTQRRQLEIRLQMLLREIRKTSGAEREEMVGREVQHEYDALFVDHALAFRGSRAEIKSRLGVYAPYVREAFAATQGAAALDLGCGRGEWLELLREMNVPASGIDWNAELVGGCREMGLEAREGSVPGSLDEIADESLAVFTAFHLLEHVSFGDLLQTIDTAVRVLKPGGIAIFETPNPKNILVSTNTFYLDPTHRNPIPSDLLAFLVEARGLCDPKVIPLSVPAEEERLRGSECAAVRFLNEHFFSAWDYGIVAYKV